MRRRGIEHHAVEHAVNKVADGSGQHHRQTDDVSRTGLVVNLQPQVVSQQTDGRNAEERQGQFRAYLHAVSHAVVLDERDVEPVKDPDALMERHVGLDPDFNQLVNHDGADNDNRCQPAIG